MRKTSVAMNGVSVFLSASRFAILLVLFLALATRHVALLYGQTGAAAVSGEITDSQNRAIPAVDVELKNVDTGVSSVTKTNGDGFYSIPGLPPGHYVMSVRKDQFRTVSVTGITLNVQDNLSRNFVLQIGSSAESITVESGGINMNTTDAAVSTVIDRQFVENIPLNGRSFQDLLTLAPGVTLFGAYNGATVGSSGEITVNGQRTEANSFTVDGVSANVGTTPGNFGNGGGFAGGTPAETVLGTTQSMVSVDALQEFRATTSTYSAEYGRTPGGQFSFTTRSGSNDWHGSAFDYFRNEAMDANNWFNNASNPQVPREKERQNDFGGALGGPIWIPHVYNGKDKTFFFFSYEGLRLWIPQGLQVMSVPDQALRQQAPAALRPILDAFSLPNAGEDGLNDGLGIYQVNESYPASIDNVNLRVDQAFNDKFKIFGRFANTPTVSSDYSGSEKNNTIINNRVITLGATYLINARQANELRFNITQVNSIQSFDSTDQGGATPFDVTTLPGLNGSNFPANGSNLEFALAFGGYALLELGKTENSQRQYNVTDTYSWALGRHSLKFGVDWRRLSTYSTPILVSVYAAFPSEAAVLANNVGSDGGIYPSLTSPSPVEPLYKNFSAFAQDEWKITPRLSLSLGLRWDVNPAPSNLTGPSPYTLNQITNLDTAQLAPAGTPLWKTDWLGFAPRVGAARQLRTTPGSETVLRAGLGVFYDMGNSQGSTGFGAVGFYSSSALTNVGFPLTSQQMTLPPPSLAAPYDNTVEAFDPNLRLPYTLQWNVAVEQALGNKQALTVSYVGSAGRRLLETYFVSPPNNPYFGSGVGGEGASITKNGPTSNYNALQVQLRRALSHGLQALASYTYSHSIDDGSSNFGLNDLFERASSDFDLRHNFQAALTYSIPGQYSNSLLSETLEHWGVDARITARSALPVDVLTGAYYVYPGTDQQVQLHPNLVPSEPLYLYGSQYPGGKVINFDAFSYPQTGQPGFGEEGNTPRNYARGFGAWQVNTAIRREFPIHESLRLQFRAEAFNLFNRANFGGVGRVLSNGPWNPQAFYGFGGATNTLNNSLGGLNSLYQTGGPRSLQIALKLIF